MANSAIVSELQVDGFVFPSTVKPPGSSKTLILGGAGARGLEIQGKFVKFTAIGVYVEGEAIPLLAVKWKGKKAEELADSVDFYRDIVTGSFEKHTRVSMILPLTGQQYVEKAAENCVKYLKAVGIYTEAEARAIEKLKEAFKEQNFPPGASILFKYSPSGSLTIGFSKDGMVSEQGNAVIENKPLSEALLESIIGKRGISPEAKRSLAVRVSQLLMELDAEKLPTERECEMKSQANGVIVE